MRVYISGKITGYEGYMERFQKAEDWLTLQGYEPVNPARVNRQLPAGTTYAEYMRMALAMLEMCDALFLLSNWRSSAGAQAEYYYAIALKKKIIYEKKDIYEEKT